MTSLVPLASFLVVESILLILAGKAVDHVQDSEAEAVGSVHKLFKVVRGSKPEKSLRYKIH